MLEHLTALAVDNITIDANTISTTNTNGALDITPNGTGNINLYTDKVEIIATEGESSTLTFVTDEADDNGDIWSFIHNTDNSFSISTNVSGNNSNYLILNRPNATDSLVEAQDFLVVYKLMELTVFNETSLDVDFRVETNAHTHALFIDGGYRT